MPLDPLETMSPPAAVNSGGSGAISREVLRSYYENVGPDYEAWSVNYNMHFGFWRPWLNPFGRERMLEETSYQVFNRLFSGVEEVAGDVLDLGCGLGGSMRTGALKYPQKRFQGVTIVERQVLESRILALREGLHQKITFSKGDFQALPFSPESFDACYAIEAASHAEGFAKRAFLSEAARVLRPGGRFVVFDCFLKRPPSAMSSFLKACYRIVCEGWVVGEFAQLPAFSSAVSASGFHIERCEEISWNVAPSVAHAPFVVTSFLLKKLLRGERLSAERLRHLRSCLLAGVLGMSRNFFGYYLVTCVKKG